MWAFWPPRSPPAEKPLRDELLSIERLEERALALAASFTIDPNPRRKSHNIFPRFEDNVRVLRGAYRTLADDVRTGQFVASAAEWLLDNFHLVTAEVTDIRRNLPRTYYRELPTLAARERAGHARIYAVAIELVRHSDSRLHRQRLTRFLNNYHRAGLESILGLRRRGATFSVDPCIPSLWPEYQITWRMHDTRYEISISNPEHRCRGVAKAELDGRVVNAAAIPFIGDGGVHHVRGELGHA